jgi:hypothetical protein
LTARVVLGPQADRFTEAGIATFLHSPFSVSSKSNRQGARLIGPSIEHTQGADLISEGIAHGAVQVPGDGQPIVLLAGRQTVGGYVKIATVVGADLDAFGQLRPGNIVRFNAVSVREARGVTLAYRARLGPDAVAEDGISLLGGGWTPEVIRLIESLEGTGVSALSLKHPGLRLKLRRRSSGWVGHSPSESR